MSPSLVHTLRIAQLIVGKVEHSPLATAGCDNEPPWPTGAVCYSKEDDCAHLSCLSDQDCASTGYSTAFCSEFMRHRHCSFAIVRSSQLCLAPQAMD